MSTVEVAGAEAGVAGQKSRTTEYNLSPELRTALAKVESVEGERVRIESALTTARRDAATAASDLETARERLADTESAAVLAGSSVDQEARRAVTALRDSVEAAEARVRGLQRRLVTSETIVSEARGEVERAWREWKRGVAQELFTELHQVGEEFRATLQLAVAIGSALDIPRAISAYRDAAFYDPMDPKRNMLSPARDPWRNNPSAVALYESLTALRRPIDQHIGNGTATHSPAAVDLVSDSAPAASA